MTDDYEFWTTTLTLSNCLIYGDVDTVMGIYDVCFQVTHVKKYRMSAEEAENALIEHKKTLYYNALKLRLAFKMLAAHSLRAIGVLS